MSFAQTTQAGAVAALGEDIRDYPDATRSRCKVPSTSAAPR
jgi:hypothetical protein